MKDKFYQCLEFELGYICLETTDSFVTRLFFSKNPVDEFQNILTRNCITQLEQYLRGERKVFDCPTHICGTDFQLHVYYALQTIPYGQVVTYKELAEEIGHPRAYRAVANALAANPLPIILPCHRVVASKGLGGYSPGIEIKKFLLSLEGVTI